MQPSASIEPFTPRSTITQDARFRRIQVCRKLKVLRLPGGNELEVSGTNRPRQCCEFGKQLRYDYFSGSFSNLYSCGRSRSTSALMILSALGGSVSCMVERRCR